MKIADLDTSRATRAISVPFRRYRGQSLRDVAAQAPDYLLWAAENTDWGAQFYEEIQSAVRHAYAAQAAAVEPLPLTPHQLAQAEGILKAFSQHHPIVRLQGGAGVGKSYTVFHIVRQMLMDQHQVNASAVSYVATQVLNRQLKQLNVEARTLARNLKFTKGFDEETGAEVFDHSPETPLAAQELLDERRLLVIDECSMISDRDADLLLRAATEGYGKLLLVGDRFQLPPVKQDDFSQCCLVDVPTFELQEPMRYHRDSALFTMESQMRNAPRQWRNAAYDEQTLCHEPPEGVVAAFVETYHADPTALHRMLFYRRKQVMAANRILRAEIFPGAQRDIEPGEKLMVLATENILPADLPNDADELADKTKGLRYYSGETFDVAEVREDVYKTMIDGQYFEIPHLQVKFAQAERPVRVVFGLDENSVDDTRLGGEAFQHALSCARALGRSDRRDERGKRIWGPLWNLQARFLRVAYTYATTIHRAQGQTMDYVYTDPGQLVGLGGRMGHALAYVACTRASRRLMTL